MSTLIAEPPVQSPPQSARTSPGFLRRQGRRLGRWLGLVARIAIGGILCFTYPTALIAVGWTQRLLRRRIWTRLWNQADPSTRDSLPDFLATLSPAEARPGYPRWFLAEEYQTRIQAPRPDGRAPSLVRRSFRRVTGLFESLGLNLFTGIAVVLCTSLITLPGCFLWLAAWYDGWNNSFNKGYEQATVGPLTGVLGSALFILAMLHIPLAWAHMAASGQVRSFFQFGLVNRLVRQRPGLAALYAATFSLAALPVNILRAIPLFLPNMFPHLNEATPAQVQQAANTLIFWGGITTFALFVATHLLAGRWYRLSLLSLLKRDPAALELFPAPIRAGIDQLGLVPDPPTGRRHPVLRVAVSTSRKVWATAMWAGILALWFALVAQIFVSEFLNHQPVRGWMNQPLVHIPTVTFPTQIEPEFMPEAGPLLP